MSPISPNLNVGLRDAAVTDEQPETEYALGHDVQHSIYQDLGVNRGLAGAVGKGPDTWAVSVMCSSEATSQSITHIG